MSFSSELIKIFDDLGRRFGIAIDWSNQNIVPYIQELVGRFIKWEIGTSILWIVLGLFFIILNGVLIKPVFNKIKNASYDEDMWIFLIVVNIVLFIVGFIIVFCQGFDIIKTIYLPELKLYEYIQFKF